MGTARKSRLDKVRIGKNLTFSIARLNSLAAQHDADHEPAAKRRRPRIGKLSGLIERFPSSADVPPYVAVPISKKDHARLLSLAEHSGRAVEAIVSGWVHNELARVGRR
jgi:hypothetical protein